MSKKYTWLYEIVFENQPNTQCDTYHDFMEIVEMLKDDGWAVMIVHATKNNPVTYAYIYQVITREKEVTGLHIERID